MHDAYRVINFGGGDGPPGYHHLSPRKSEETLASIVRASSLAYCAMSRVTPRLRFIEPQLPSLVDQPPEGKHWIHEVKHDGYRSQVLVERGEARVFTRNGYDWSDRYPSIVRAAAKVLRGFESQAKASRSRLLQNKPLRVARRLSRLLEKNWVHCRPRPGRAVLIGVAFRRRLTGSKRGRAS